MHTLTDWGHCKDLKAKVLKIAPDLGSDPDAFALLDTYGWTTAAATAAADAHAGTAPGMATVSSGLLGAMELPAEVLRDVAEPAVF